MKRRLPLYLLVPSALLLVLLLFFVVYVSPSLKSISRLRREARDLQRSVADARRAEQSFVFGDAQEEALLAAAQTELRRMIPTIRQREGFLRFFTGFFDSVQKTAAADGVRELLITANSRELQVNASPLAGDRKSLAGLLGFSAEHIGTPGRAPAAPPTEASPLMEKNLAYEQIYLAFSAESRPMLNFLNHLGWGAPYRQLDRIVIAAGPERPQALVFVKVYFFDERSGRAQ